MSLSRTALLAFPVTMMLALAACDDAPPPPKATVTDAPKGSAAAHATAAKTGAPATTGAAPAAAGAETLAIDAASSSVGFEGAKVTGKHPGKFNTFSGSVMLAGGKPSGVKVEIDLASVKSDSEKLDGHLKAPDFFDVAKFPQATFTSTGIKDGGDKGATHTITGELDLHGVKKTISFPATLNVTGDVVTGTADFTINRKDFGIVYPGMANDLIKDDVAIKLSIKAPRKKG